MTSLILAAALVAAPGATPMEIHSDAFRDSGAIPAKNTCSGQDASPALTWSGVPPGAKSLAVIVDDPDAHHFTHWLLYDLPPDASGVAEGASGKGLPAGAHEGVNDFGKPGWRGPCPPSGRHHYVFTVYALDTAMPNLTQARRVDVDKAIKGHVLAQGTITGTFAKGGAVGRRAPAD
jgi:Raf kinase inhibitor-like YbhB/YbcL family protein